MFVRGLLVTVSSLFLALTATASWAAESVSLTRAHQVGDRYELSLRLEHRKHASSPGRDARPHAEAARYIYTASVTVLDVDRAGMVVHERHDDAALQVALLRGHGNLIEDVSVLEVKRDPRGPIQVYLDGYRAKPQLERIFSEVFASQFEYSEQLQALDPGRPVEFGERWEIGREEAQEILEAWGIRGERFDEAPVAWIAVGPYGHHVLHFDIPVGRVRPLDGLPKNMNASKAPGRLQGEIDLAEGGGAIAARASLSFEMQGRHSAREAMARGKAWELTSNASFDQSRHVTHLAGIPTQVAQKREAPVPARRYR